MTGASTCTDCPIDRYSNPGMSTCQLCPRYGYRHISGAFCLCDTGEFVDSAVPSHFSRAGFCPTYQNSGPQHLQKCELCAALGKTGVWNFARDNATLGYDADISYVCPAGYCQEQACASGRKAWESNPLCGSCLDGYSEWNGQCICQFALSWMWFLTYCDLSACSEPSAAGISVMVVIILIYVIVVHLLVQARAVGTLKSAICFCLLNCHCSLYVLHINRHGHRCARARINHLVCSILRMQV